MSSPVTKSDVYAMVTDRILESLARGVVPWRCPWTTSAPRNLVSRKEYRGANVLLLQSAGHSSPYWLTFKQALALKGGVRKGEKGTPVIFWKVYDDKADPSRKRFVLRYFTVFNVSQCDGIAPPAADSVPRPVDPIAECEALAGAYVDGPSVVHAGAQACYSPASDTVRMPPRETFTGAPEYYSTLFHELAHSTGAASRLARKGVMDPVRFASHGYAQEELVAECGAAFLCAHAGISPATIENQAAYIESWSKKLRSDPRCFVEAAGAAAKAADRIAPRPAEADIADESEAA